MDDYFQFMVMNSWKINMNLPVMFGDRQAVRCQIWVHNFSSWNLYWVGNLASKDGYFFSRGEGGGGDISESSIYQFQSFSKLKFDFLNFLKLLLSKYTHICLVSIMIIVLMMVYLIGSKYVKHKT